MADDLLERKVALAEILDQDSLQRVCMTYARMWCTGVAVFDQGGQALVDVPAELPLCRFLGTHPAGSSLCTGFDERVSQVILADPAAPAEVECGCGLRYLVVSIRHEGTPLGRLALGPLRPVEVEGLPDEVRALLETKEAEPDSAPGETPVARAQLALEKTPPLDAERALAAIQSLKEVIKVIVQTGYARHLTSQIHIAAIQDAYNELTEKNRRLADSVEKLKELDKIKSSFLATVSHELRTPLTSVIGYSEMLIEGLAGDLAPDQRDYIQIIMEKGEQLLQIINEVLNISKIETGNIQLACEHVNIPDLLRQVTDAVMPQARRKEIRLEYSAPDTMPPVWADRGKTRQTLLNLLSNAIKFTPRKGFVGVVAEETQMNGASHSDACQADASQQGAAQGASDPGGPPAVLIRVEDNGIGIPKDSRERVFESFYQVDSSSTREYGGTGLGLSIVKNFVEAHGGRVWAGERQGGGAVLSVLLPINPTPATVGRARRQSKVMARSQQRSD